MRSAIWSATAIAASVRSALQKVSEDSRVRVLFSAHGLPKKIVERGDPYQWQVERTAQAVVDELGIGDLDWLQDFDWDWDIDQEEEEQERSKTVIKKNKTKSKK